MAIARDPFLVALSPLVADLDQPYTPPPKPGRPGLAPEETAFLQYRLGAGRRERSRHAWGAPFPTKGARCGKGGADTTAKGTPFISTINRCGLYNGCLWYYDSDQRSLFRKLG